MLIIWLPFCIAFSLAQDYLDALRSFEEVCRYHGYQVKSYQVTTEDGYILTLFRIPGKVGETIKSKPVIFLQHGLIDLADTWIMNKPSPAFILSDAGFDIWLGNSRGSFHSLGHMWLDSKKDKEYWQFSWMHMADFDVPAMVEFVIEKTCQSRLTFVGHSQGTLQMFAHLADHPEFMKNLNIFIALGPVASVKNIEVDLLKTAKEFPIFDILEMNNIHEFLPNMQTNLLFYMVCRKYGSLCDKIVEFYADMQVDEVDNVERFPVILAHETGGTSVMNMKHFQQMLNYEKYQLKRFDYGELQNKKKYGNIEPPAFNLSKISAPVALFSGTLDRLADMKDVQWLREQLAPGVVVFDKVLRFGHASFMWGKDLSYLQDVIILAKQH